MRFKSLQHLVCAAAFTAANAASAGPVLKDVEEIGFLPSMLTPQLRVLTDQVPNPACLQRTFARYRRTADFTYRHLLFEENTNQTILNDAGIAAIIFDCQVEHAFKNPPRVKRHPQLRHSIAQQPQA